VQGALARVYLDRAVREALRRGERTLADEYGLTAEEYEAVRGVVIDQAEGVEIFARTLDRKREERVASFYPLVENCIGPERWQVLFEQYVDGEPIAPSGVAADAAAFGRFVREQLTSRPGVDAALLDVLTLEETKAELGDVPDIPGSREDVERASPNRLHPRLMPHARIRRLCFRPRDLQGWIARGRPSPIDVPAVGAWVVLYATPRCATVHTAELGFWLGCLLQRADGTASLAELLDSVCGGNAPEVATATCAALRDLHRAGVVELRRKEGGA
jgi:hypothetical protein